MLQTIITYIIISGATGYTLYRFIRLIIPGKSKTHSHTCSAGCSGCAGSSGKKQTAYENTADSL